MGISTWQQAEQRAAAWMRSNGFRDARTTNGAADGGIDVVSRTAIAQVKFEKAKTGRPAVQRLVGARGNRGTVSLLFFSASGYSDHAVTYANSMRIGLFLLGPDGVVRTVNGPAKDIVRKAKIESNRLVSRAKAAGVPLTDNVDDVLRKVNAFEAAKRAEDQARRAVEKAARLARKEADRSARSSARAEASEKQRLAASIRSAEKDAKKAERSAAKEAKALQKAATPPQPMTWAHVFLQGLGALAMAAFWPLLDQFVPLWALAWFVAVSSVALTLGCIYSLSITRPTRRPLGHEVAAAFVIVPVCAGLFLIVNVVTLGLFGVGFPFAITSEGRKLREIQRAGSPQAEALSDPLTL